MMSRRITCARRIAALSFAKSAVVGVLVFAAVDAARAIEISIGPQEVIYTKSKRISTWPDGNLGPISNGDGTYDFYAANGPKPVKTTGTLTTPGSSKKSVKIVNVPKKTFNYVSGGPVYEDPTTGARLMVYHAEVHGKKKSDFHSVLGMAVSTDLDGLIFRDLGTIIEPTTSGPVEVGGGSFAVFDNYFNVYYRDYLPDGTASEVAVARAPISDLISNALSGQATSFTKYYNGSWSEPGRGGKSSALEISNAANSWLSVSYNDYLDQVVMVSSQWVADGGDLYLATSPDGVNWSPRQPLAGDPGEQFYPTIIGTGPDPTHSDQSFYVYYTDSKKGAWSRWKDAQLIRRAITIDPNLTPIVQSLVLTGNPPPPPPADDWAQISGYQSDFQGGTPAEGWKYAWNPKGKLGKPDALVPLLWSDAAQAYNTTGAATQIPGKKSHHDDYLMLTADGGHPGEPKYLPMAGYTIQADDGAGLYRIADSSILRTDTLLNQKKEDGLQVLVYVNDQQIGAAQNVLANGLLTSFDRELGQLSIGDTVWVMISALKNQTDDSFSSFDFSLQKWGPLVQNQFAALMSFDGGLQTGAVPEPATAVLLLIAIPTFWPCRKGMRIRRTAP